MLSSKQMQILTELARKTESGHIKWQRSKNPTNPDLLFRYECDSHAVESEFNHGRFVIHIYEDDINKQMLAIENLPGWEVARELYLAATDSVIS
jgi:hypothetical protein